VLAHLHLLVSDEAHRSTNINNMVYYKRNLPHYQPEGYSYFVTFRLVGSLPLSVINKLKNDREKELEEILNIKGQKLKSEKYFESQRNYFSKFDGFLDKNKKGPHWLKNEKITEIVKKAIHKRDKIEYDLIAYTIMPNHVHIAFTPIVDRDLPTGQAGLFRQIIKVLFNN